MKKIQKKDNAIQFEATDYLGNKVRLSDYKGKKVLLSFFRGASCPFCNMRLKEMIKRHNEFKEKEIEIITLFTSTKTEIDKYAGKQNAPFIIIPDPELVIYKDYDIEQSKSGMYKAMIKPLKMMKMMTSGFFNTKSLKDEPIIPADFLIDKNQIVYKIYYGKDFGDHLSINEILNW